MVAQLAPVQTPGDTRWRRGLGFVGRQTGILALASRPGGRIYFHSAHLSVRALSDELKSR